MARWITTAAIHYQATELGTDTLDTAIRQLREGLAMLDGTHVDLVVTCEGMSSCQWQSTRQGESQQQPGILWNMYADFARKNQCTLAGSIVLEEAGKNYNSLVFFGPDGNPCGSYHKAFPTIREMEWGITAGTGANIVETPAGRLGGVICFDLNFDELRDQYRKLQPDILCFSSMFHGGHMQKNWAYQCRCFLASSCKDNTSDIVDPHGRVMNSTNYYNRIAWARLNIDRWVMHQDGNNIKFADIRKKYGQRVLIDAASDLGTCVLYSLDESITARQIALEFELQHIDDYLNSSRRNIANRQ